MLSQPTQSVSLDPRIEGRWTIMLLVSNVPPVVLSSPILGNRTGKVTVNDHSLGSELLLK